MKRALRYSGERAKKAVKYQEKPDKGMEAEAKAEREQAKLEQEAAIIEKRREERRRTAPREPVWFRSARRQRRR